MKSSYKKVFFIVSGIILLFLAVSWFTYLGQKRQPEKISSVSFQENFTFGIYLADKNQILLSDKDIVSYDNITHTFKLTDEAIKKLEDLNATQGLGKLYQKKFVVRLMGKELYQGQIWSNLSSLTPSGIIMSDPMFTHINKEIRISAFSFAEPQVKDMLDNPDLLEYFEKQAKLVSISEDQSVSSTEKMLQDLIPYKNDYLGISFDYPRYYKDTRCDVAIKQEDEDIKGVIGSRIEMSVTPYSESVLNINHLVSSTLSNIQITTQKNMTIDGEKYLQVGYRFGGMNRYGETTYIIHNKKLYTLGFTSGEFECGFEPMVYEKVLETLKFK